LACSGSNSLVALAHWNAISEISLRRADSLDTVEANIVLDEAIRSVAFIQQDLLVVGLGDGQLYVLSIPDLSTLRKFSLGAKPVRLFSWHDKALLAISERGAVVSHKQRLEFTAVHLEMGDWTDAKCAPLNDNKIVLWRPDGKGMQVMRIEHSRQMRARSIKLHGQPRAVCLKQDVLFVAMAADRNHATRGGVIRFLRDKPPHKDLAPALELNNFEEPLICRCLELKIDDEDEFLDNGIHSKKQRLDSSGRGVRSTDLGTNFVASLFSTQNQDISKRAPSRAGSRSFVVVGTAIPGADDFEPSAGRILVLEETQVKWSREVEGAVYDVCALGKKRIACCVNHAVLVFDVSLETQLAVYEGFVTALRLSAPTESRIIVGDLMRSVSVLEMSTATSTSSETPALLNLDEVARDLNAHWTAALYANKNETLLSEAGHNLLALHQRAKRRTGPDKEDHRMDTKAAMHLGDYASCFCPGSFSIESSHDSTKMQQKPLLFGCVSGRIGCILPVFPDQIIRLDRVQRAIARASNFIGGLDFFSISFL